MKERLEKIEARCKKLGWEFAHRGIGDYKPQIVISNDYESHVFDKAAPGFPQAAEALLELHEPGPMVKIGGFGDTCLTCDLHGSHCIMGWEDENNKETPGANCPAVLYGPGTFKLVEVVE